jgi:hypothetical protein
MKLRYKNYQDDLSNFNVSLTHNEKHLGDALLKLPELYGRIVINYVSGSARNFDRLEIARGEVIFARYSSGRICRVGVLKLFYTGKEADDELYDVVEHTYEIGGTAGLVFSQ